MSAARDLPRTQVRAAAPRDKAKSPRVLDSTHLLDGAREVLIRHAGSEYRLRLTQLNKLILTK